jgi:hypothetical protein
LLDEKDCKLHGHCIVYVGDQFIIKFHANIMEIFKMQFVVFLVRGFSNEIFTFKILLRS